MFWEYQRKAFILHWQSEYLTLTLNKPWSVCRAMTTAQLEPSLILNASLQVSTSNAHRVLMHTSDRRGFSWASVMLNIIVCLYTWAFKKKKIWNCCHALSVHLRHQSLPLSSPADCLCRDFMPHVCSSCFVCHVMSCEPFKHLSPLCHIAVLL